MRRTSSSDLEEGVLVYIMYFVLCIMYYVLYMTWHDMTWHDMTLHYITLHYIAYIHIDICDYNVYCKKLSEDEGNAKLQLFARTKKFLRSRECGVSSGCEKWGHHGLEKDLSMNHDRFFFFFYPEHDFWWLIDNAQLKMKNINLANMKTYCHGDN